MIKIQFNYEYKHLQNIQFNYEHIPNTESRDVMTSNNHGSLRSNWMSAHYNSLTLFRC